MRRFFPFITQIDHLEKKRVLVSIFSERPLAYKAAFLEFKKIIFAVLKLIFFVDNNGSMIFFNKK